jgi:hypothetical protein
MSTKQTNQQNEERSSKVRDVFFWILVLVAAVLPFPFWP